MNVIHTLLYNDIFNGLFHSKSGNTKNSLDLLVNDGRSVWPENVFLVGVLLQVDEKRKYEFLDLLHFTTKDFFTITVGTLVA